MINSLRLPAIARSVAACGVMLAALGGSAAAESQLARGKYLVTIISCSDCHTQGTFLGKPDLAPYLGGSDVGFEVPGLGVFYGPNLTSDKDTGLGNWTKEQIATAITTGKRPDGRVLAPPMPVQSFKALGWSDAMAIATYLKTLKPVTNKVPGPFGPGQKPTSFVYQVLPSDKYVPTVPPPPAAATPVAPAPAPAAKAAPAVAPAPAPAAKAAPAVAPAPVPAAKAAPAAAPVPGPATSAPPMPGPAVSGAPVPVPTPAASSVPAPGPASASPPEPGK